MSLDYLKSVFTALKSMDSFSVQLLRKTSSSEEVYYYTREIGIQPEESLTAFVHSLSEKYEKEMDAADPIDDYMGDIVKGRMYRLPLEDEMIWRPYQALENAAADPKKEGKVLGGEWHALLIRSRIDIQGEIKPVMLVSMRSPVSVLKNRFQLFERDQFRELDKPVLTLNKSLDAVIVDGIFYMLTMQAENLFDMERSYRKRCGSIVEEIARLDILSDADAFTKVAVKGQNPRRFVSFNQNRLNAIKTVRSRKKYMKMFHIAMKGDRIDTKDEKSCERLVKFLCEKAMLDPVDEQPREVAAAKVWS